MQIIIKDGQSPENIWVSSKQCIPFATIARERKIVFYSRSARRAGDQNSDGVFAWRNAEMWRIPITIFLLASIFSPSNIHCEVHLKNFKAGSYLSLNTNSRQSSPDSSDRLTRSELQMELATESGVDDDNLENSCESMQVDMQPSWKILESQRQKLVEEICRLSKLPKSSGYAQHRLKIAEKALDILNKSSQNLSAGDMDELERALSQLGF
jgi:hypothetical protein